jgi:hypothetical protein
MKNYSELTIKQFLRCKTIADLETDPIMRKVKMLAEIEGKDVDEVESMPIGDLLARLKGLEQIEAMQPDQKIKLKFKLGGKRFIVKWRQQDLTAAQYIDATHFCKDPDKIIHNIHNILAALVVERTWWGKEKKYNGDKHKEIADLFYNEMKISTAYPIMLFFCRYYEALVANIITYLGEEAERQMSSIKDMVGLQR